MGWIRLRNGKIAFKSAIRIRISSILTTSETMKFQQMTFMCIFSGFMGAFFAMACGATGGKSANADDGSDDIVDDGGDDITPIDDVILTKRIVECSIDWDYQYWINDCWEDNLSGTEVWGGYYIKNGQPDFRNQCAIDRNCDSYRIVIIE